jgi:hypothetical protein
MLRYKLVTLPKDVIGIPVISVAPSSVSFNSLAQAATITPATLNLAGGNSTMGYTAVLSDDTVATLEVAPDGTIANATSQTAATAGATSVTNFLTDEVTSTTTAGKTVVRVGSKFIIKPKTQADLTTVKKALLTIIGNETGGFQTISVTVDPSGFAALDISGGVSRLTP